MPKVIPGGFEGSPSFSSSKGFTLVEIIIGMVIITVAFLTLAQTFTAISKGILVNKTKTIATNLAQEKIESLKNLSYFRLLVTTASTTDSNFPGMTYDIGTTNSYYPEETLYVAGLQFKRRVMVEFMDQSGTDLQALPWTSNDTGIKRVTVYVVWQETDGWKKVEMRNLKNNPDRASLNYSFTGKVSSGTTGNPLYNALVQTQENPAFFGRTDANGKYSFKVQPGTYTLQAIATGYFTAVSTSYIVASNQTGSSNQDFPLTLMLSGNASGFAYIRNHLVITQIVGSTDTTDNNGWEWVELHNPTTYDILIASRTTTNGSFDIFFVTVSYICRLNDDPATGVDNNGSHGANPKEFAFNIVGNNPSGGSNNGLTVNFRSSSNYWTVNTPTIAIPANAYFLIANASTITAVNGVASISRIADCYYTRGGGDANNVIAVDAAGATAGGIRVTGVRGYNYNGRSDWHDGIAWGLASAPALAAEGGGCTGGGLMTQYVGYRHVFKSSDTSPNLTQMIIARTSYPFTANDFDRDINCGGSSGDLNAALITSLIYTSSGIYNSDVKLAPYYGTPAAGASVSAADGLSSIAYVQAYGSFTLTGMATGSWTVTVSSGNYTRDITSVTIVASVSTGIPNGITGPAWEIPRTTFSGVGLTTSTIYGYVSGVVSDIYGAGINNAQVTAAGAAAAVNTDSKGKYRLSIQPSGVAVDITASKSGLSTEIVQSIGISLGIDVSTVNFTLIAAGAIKGFITTNGAPSGALPGIPVIAYDQTTSTIKGSAITGVDGTFNIPSVDTGTWIVAPQLDTGETVVPDSVTVTVISNSTGTWSSTFTITNAFGSLTGTVSNGSSTAAITTGVLIVASTTTITADTPPNIDAGARADSIVYYAASSDSSGSYTLPIRGNASYYIYGWYPNSLDVVTSSTPKRSGTRTFVGPNQTITVNLKW